MRADVALNVSLYLADASRDDRPGLAAALGFSAIECWWPFDGPRPRDRDVDRFIAGVRASGVQLELLNLYAGDMRAGDRGIVAKPGSDAAFADTLGLAAQVCRELSCPLVHAVYGKREPGVTVADQHAVAAERLAHAASSLAAVGATPVVEMLNPTDTPGVLLDSLGAAASIVDALPGVYLQFDTYHVARTGQDPGAAFPAVAARVRHVQVADVPGRGAPGTGAIDFDAFWSALRDSGYAGVVGLEHVPGAGDFDYLRSLAPDTWIRQSDVGTVQRQSG